MPDPDGSRGGRAVAAVTAIASVTVIAVVAFAAVWWAGHRGFLPFDQSIVFDGGYRVLLGQVPYRDFVAPCGVLLYWIQALVFRFAGITYDAYVGLAAVENVIASVAAWAILARCLPTRRFWPLLGGLLTGLWFYPPYGTPWFEQTGSMFGLLGTLALLPRNPERGPGWPGALIAGVCIGLAALCKQNTALFLLPVLGVLLVVTRAGGGRRVLRDLLLLVAGFAAVAGAFAAWLAIQANLDLFRHYAVDIPARIGRDRVLLDWKGSVRALVLGGDSSVAQVVTNLCGLIGVVGAAFAVVNAGHAYWNRWRVPAVLLVLLVLYQNALARTTLNQPANGFPYIGVIVAIAGGWISTLVGRLSISILDRESDPIRVPRRTTVGRVAGAAIVLIVAFLGYKGFDVARRREVHDVFAGSDFSGRCAVPILDRVRWGVPTPIGGEDLDAVGLQAAVSFLQKKNQRFFVFKELTLLYAMLDVPSPQPLLWFHPGLTYPAGGDPMLDEWIRKSLVDNDVNIVLVERTELPLVPWQVGLSTTRPMAQALRDFPGVRDLIATHFAQSPSIGHFEVYERTHPR